MVLCVCVLSDTPVIRCPQHVDVEQDIMDDGKPLTLSCDVQSYPAFTVHWRCCGMDRDIPDSVLYEKVRLKFLLLLVRIVFHRPN